MAIDLYEYAPSPFCRSVKTVARIVGVDLNLHVVNIFEKDNMKPEFLAINPFHTIPAMNDNGFILTESRAILTYLVEKYASDDSLYPKDVEKRSMINQMLFLDSGTTSNSIVGIVKPWFTNQEPSAEAKDKLKEHLKIFDDLLSKRKYMATNELSLADIAIRCMFGMLDLVDYDISEYKNVSAWADRVRQQLPDYEEINVVPLKMLKESHNSKSN